MTEIISLPDLAPAHQAVGRGITAFASVQFGLNMVFASMMEPAHRAWSVAAIEAGRSFDLKLKMADDVAKIALTGEDVATWGRIHRKLSERNDFRNKLAHWMVVLYPGARSAEDAKKMKPGLVPHVGSMGFEQAVWNADGNHKTKAITIEQMDQHSDLCNKLVIDLLRFSEALQNRKRIESELVPKTADH